MSTSKDSASKTTTRDEEKYYEPIRQHLIAVFSNRYVEHEVPSSGCFVGKFAKNNSN